MQMMETLGNYRVTYSLPRDEFYKSLLIFLIVGGVSVWYVLATLVVFALAGRRGEVLVVAALLPLLIAPLGYRFLRYGRRLFSWRTLRVYDHGFVLTERGDVLVVHWQDIVTYHVKAERLGVDYLGDHEAAQMSARLNYILQLTLNEGRQLIIESSVRQMADAIESIGRRYALHHLPMVHARLQERGQYYFGNLIIQADRMDYQAISYRWYQLEKVTFQIADDLVVEQKGAPRPRVVLPTAKIPNPHLLMLYLSAHTTVYDFGGRRVSLEVWQRSVNAPSS